MSLEQKLSESHPMVVYSSESRIRHPRAFCRDGLKDLRTALPTAVRFFKRNLAQRYRYSSLGLFWAFVPSIITALVLTAGQRTRLISSGQLHVPAPFYGVFGLAMGQTFLEALIGLRAFFSGHQNLLRRNNVPLEGLIIAAVLEILFNTLVRMVVLAAAFFFFGVHPVRHLPLALVGMLGILLIGAGLGLLLAPFNSLKRDIENIMAFLPWILFATTPVFVAAKSNSPMVLVYRWNALAYIFDSTRVLAYGGTGTPWPALLSLPVGLGLLLLGWIACRLWRPYVVERMLV